MSKIKPYLIIMIFIISLTGIFYVWTNMESMKLGYEINKLETIKAKLVHKNKKLLIVKASLTSPSRIYKIAKKLGFVYPKEGEVVMIHE
ncbi:MAG: cell division protein FtsL [bacterium]